MAERIGFGPYLFDPSSGELQRSDGTAETVRLSPQPSRLLALLAASAPEVVSREEIRATIWNGVEVEFDSSLHFCVRQIRSALNESADAPLYIENLPRRGYRFLATVRSIDVEPSSAADTAAVKAPRPRRSWGLMLFVGALALTAGVAAWLATGEGLRQVRVGVLPFGAAANLTAENLVVGLTRDPTRDWAVVGPSSTTVYAGTGSLRDVLEALNLDYVFHVREIPGPPERRLLEWIRRDGAHVWVRYLDEVPPDTDLLNFVQTGLTQTVTETDTGTETPQ